MFCIFSNFSTTIGKSKGAAQPVCPLESYISAGLYIILKVYEDIYRYTQSLRYIVEQYCKSSPTLHANTIESHIKRLKKHRTHLSCFFIGIQSDKRRDWAALHTHSASYRYYISSGQLWWSGESHGPYEGKKKIRLESFDSVLASYMGCSTSLVRLYKKTKFTILTVSPKYCRYVHLNLLLTLYFSKTHDGFSYEISHWVSVLLKHCLHLWPI